MPLQFSITDVIAVLPEIIIGAGACVLLVIDLFIKKKEVIGYLAILLVIIAGFFTATLVGFDSVAMAGMVVLDNYAAFFKVIFYIATILTILLSFNYLREENLVYRGEYYALILFSLLGMMVVASAADLLTIYLGIELMAIPVYVLVGYLKNEKRSNEGAMKYIILGAFSSGLLLYGISLIYGVTGTTQLGAISASLAAGAGPGAAVTLAVILMSAGFCFKVAGFPFHMWAPDAYEGAPTTITAYMTVAVKAGAFAAIVRVFIEALYPAYGDWQLILSIVAVLSMIYGNIVAIMQTNIKRMLAYSSIGHAGYALLGLIAGTGEGSSSILFYMLVYVFMNIGVFAVIVMMKKGEHSGDMISDYVGLAKRNKVVAVLMLIFLFSLAGIPPTAGFMGKLYVFMALINQGMIILAVIAVLTSAIAAYFYIRIIVLMYMKEPEGEFDLQVSVPIYYVLLVSVGATMLLGVYPGYFMKLAQKAALLM